MRRLRETRFDNLRGLGFLSILENFKYWTEKGERGSGGACTFVNSCARSDGAATVPRLLREYMGAFVWGPEQRGEGLFRRGYSRFDGGECGTDGYSGNPTMLSASAEGNLGDRRFGDSEISSRGHHGRLHGGDPRNRDG